MRTCIVRLVVAGGLVVLAGCASTHPVDAAPGVLPEAQPDPSPKSPALDTAKENRSRDRPQRQRCLDNRAASRPCSR